MSVEWEKNERGEITLRPLVGCLIEPEAGTHLAVRLDYFRPEDPFDQPPRGKLQLAVSVRFARDLAAHLLEAADRVEQMPPSGAQN